MRKLKEKEVGGIILFDGVCNVCNTFVDFILKKDTDEFYYFASLQSEKGQQLLETYQINKELDTVVVIENHQVYLFSDSIIKIAEKLSKPWSYLRFIIIFPRPIRNFFYRVFAKRRYKLFGQKSSCRLPTKEEKRRFLS
ncbi:hypothetical protein BTS2_0014 [Bacillus sp. TS-2]|nr:hypothetical protein BTS2_0014 [Bacillus sp. TS-2]